METAQSAISFLMGLLFLTYVLGYTAVRTYEAIGNLRSAKEEREAKKAACADGADELARGTLAYAAQRRRDGHGDAPLWGAVGAVRGLGEGIVAGARWANGKRKGSDKADETETVEAPRPAPDAPAPAPAAPAADPFAEADAETPKQRKDTPELDAAADGVRVSVVHDQDDEYEPRAERRRRDEEKQARQDDTPGGRGAYWRPDYTSTEQERKPHGIEVEVEVVRNRRTPDAPAEIGKGTPALTQAATVPAPRQAEPAGGGVATVEVERVTATSGGSDLDLAEPSEIERTTDMAGQYVAVPGSRTAATSGGGIAVGSHEADKDLANRIVKAAEMTGDPVDAAEKMIHASLKATWIAVDGLEAAGIRGRTGEYWGDAAVLLEAAHKTAIQLKKDIRAAQNAARRARRHQVAVGDQVQDSITAGGASVAKAMRYYNLRGRR